MNVSTGYKDAVANAIKAALDYGVIHLFSGAKPASPNDAEAGTLLAIITDNGGAFVSGQQTNGLRLGAPAAGVLNILAGQNWKSNSCLATGVVGWGRFYANTVVQGASVVGVRFDFTVGVAGADLNLVTTQIRAGLPFAISSFSITVQ